ncbi:hypothetical protein BC936DRAFT_150040 [Jimgerdemannia flammicorona]|uniref:SET domain-containing protein n=1 Tax=Jimgerdemannia flammicorona TaxID=994334 RepID=A0A433CZL6_9FUNG|nr:hypothetical protein BC936DRAFT_150040 [Jimgerdemannia flammicorona]
MDLLFFATNHLLKTTTTAKHENVGFNLQPNMPSFYNSSSSCSTVSNNASSEPSPSLLYQGMPRASTSLSENYTSVEPAAACTDVYFTKTDGSHDNVCFEQHHNRQHRMSVSSLLNDVAPPSPPEAPNFSAAANGTDVDMTNATLATTSSWENLSVNRSPPLPSPTSPVSVSPPPSQSQNHHGHQLTPPTPNVRVNLYDLVSSGVLSPNTIVTFRDQTATVTARGTLSPNQDLNYPLPSWLQTEFETPSAFATAIVKAGRSVKVAVNGWSAVKVCVPVMNGDDSNEDGPGNADATIDVSLDVLRKRYLNRITKAGAATATSPGAPSNAQEHPRNAWNTVTTAFTLPPKKRKRANTQGSITAHASNNGASVSDDTDTQDPQEVGEVKRRWKRNHSASMVLDRPSHVIDGVAGLDAGSVKSNHGLEQDDDTHPRHSRPTPSRQSSGGIGNGKSRSRRNSSPNASSSAHGKRRPSTKARRESTSEGVSIPGSSGETKGQGDNAKKRAVAQVILASLETALADDVANVTCISKPVHPASITRGVVVAIHKESPCASSSREMCFACGAFEKLVHDNRSRKSEFAFCNKCGESFHGCCVGIEGSEGSENTPAVGWTCPRCVRCVECWRAVVEPPSMLTAGDKERDASAKRVQVHGGDVPIDANKSSPMQTALKCIKCETTTHLTCEAIKDPDVEKQAKEAEASMEPFTWVCRRCRVCVECGGCHGDDEETDALATEPSAFVVDGHSQQHRNDPTPSVDRLIKGKPVRSSLKASWSHKYRLCPTCTLLLHKGNTCPLCRRLYHDDDYDTPMVFCDGCERWVHVACDAVLKDGDYEQLGSEGTRYFCPFCRDTQTHQTRKVEEKLDCVQEEPSEWQQEELIRPPNRHRGDSFKDLLMAAESLSNGTVVFPEDDEGVYDRRYSPSSPELSTAYSRSYPTSVDANPHEHDPFAAAYATSELGMPATVTTMESTAAEALLTFLGGGFGLGHAMEISDSPSAVSPVVQVAREEEEAKRAERPDTAKPEGETLPRSAFRDRTMNDDRRCTLCTERDAPSQDLGRLIPFWSNGHNDTAPIVDANGNGNPPLTWWAHTECLLWSVGVTEDEDGGLRGVIKVVEMALRNTCKSCGLSGASVACRGGGCDASYHLTCVMSRASGNDVVAGDGPETVYCAAHKNEQMIDVVEYDETKARRKERKLFVKDNLIAPFLQELEQSDDSLVSRATQFPYVFRAGALTVCSLGAYLSAEERAKSDGLDAVCYRVAHDDHNASDEEIRSIVFPVGYCFERWIPDWRDSAGVTRVKVICEYTVTPETMEDYSDGRHGSNQLEEDENSDETKVIVRMDRKEGDGFASAVTSRLRFAWRLTTIEQNHERRDEIWRDTVVDVMSFLFEKYQYHRWHTDIGGVKMDIDPTGKESQLPFFRSTFASDYHFFELQPAAFCGLDQPCLAWLLSSMKECQQANAAVRRRQDMILTKDVMSLLFRGGAISSLKRKRTEDAVNVRSCARTAGKYKVTRRKVRKIGRSLDGASTGLHGGHVGIGIRAQQTFTTVAGQLRHPIDNSQLMANAAMMGKYRAMKLTERENVVLRPCWGSTGPLENGEAGSCQSGNQPHLSPSFGHNSEYRQQHLHPRRRSSVGASLFGNGDYFHGSSSASSSSFSAHASAPSSPLLPRQSQHPLSIMYNPTCPTSFSLCVARSFEKDDMILEYIGEVIGERVAEMRKRIYAKRSKDCYMMHGSDDWVIDASRIGMKAKFIGHERVNASTYARVVFIDNAPRIIFHASRHLEPDDELTFNYEVSSEEECVQSGER